MKGKDINSFRILTSFFKILKSNPSWCVGYNVLLPMDTSRSYLCPSIPFYLQLNTRHTSAHDTGTTCSMHQNTPCLHQLALSQPPLSKQITALEEHIVLTVDQIVALAVFGPQCTWTCNVHTTLKKTLHKTQNTKHKRSASP